MRTSLRMRQAKPALSMYPGIPARLDRRSWCQLTCRHPTCTKNIQHKTCMESGDDIKSGSDCAGDRASFTRLTNPDYIELVYGRGVNPGFEVRNLKTED